MKSSYDFLRERVNAKRISNDCLNTQFVFEGNSAIEVLINEEKYKVAIVLKEDRDMAYVYTELNKPLINGTSFTAKDLHILIVKKMTIIKDVDFNKYEALLANVELEDNVWGYFKSPEETYINTKIEGSTVEVSLQHPILVAQAGLYEIGDKFLIKDRPWEVIETDTIASDEVTYYSLKATTIEKDSSDVEKEDAPEEVPDGKVKVHVLDRITLTTQNAVFSSSTKLVDQKIKLTSVEFTVPFGITEFTVKVKQNGENKEIVYKVV